jgi:hypothetical protein
MNQIQKIVIENRFGKPMIVYLEPWGADYTLKEDEKFEIVAENCEEDFYFNIQFERNCIIVYPEGKSNPEYPLIYSNGVEIDCGYNRNLTENL